MTIGARQPSDIYNFLSVKFVSGTTLERAEQIAASIGGELRPRNRDDGRDWRASIYFAFNSPIQCSQKKDELLNLRYPELIYVEVPRYFHTC